MHEYYVSEFLLLFVLNSVALNEKETNLAEHIDSKNIISKHHIKIFIKPRIAEVFVKNKNHKLLIFNRLDYSCFFILKKIKL